MQVRSFIHVTEPYALAQWITFFSAYSLCVHTATVSIFVGRRTLHLRTAT